MKRNGRRYFAAVFCLLLIFSLVGCSKSQDQKTEYQLYYLDQNGLELHPVEYEPTKSNTGAMVEEVIQLLQAATDEEEYGSLLPKEVIVLGYQLDQDRVIVNFSDTYSDMKNTREILVRAGFVKSLIQIPGVAEVQFQVNGGSMLDSEGNVYPVMTAETFVESDGKNINSYQYTTLNLYFVDASGKNLVKEPVSVYYSSNVPLEQVVVEQLKKGSKIAGHQSPISSETKILSVSVLEGVCYVNLDSSFNAPQVVGNADPEVVIYSIVNSIMDACDVTKVQISLDGESDVTFRNSITLDQFFTRNRNLVVEEENE